MGTNAPQADAGAEGQPSADDLTRIPGIGPVIERHLREAGVRTFAQLASLSPEQIAALVAHLPLLSLERIARQDWTGRARALAHEARQRSDSATDDPGAQRATFTVELLLDAHRRVVRTRAVHLRDSAEEVWDGWDVGQLVAFFSDFVAGLDPGAGATPSHMETTSPIASAELRLELGELLVRTELEPSLGETWPGSDLRARLPFTLAGPAVTQLAAERAPYVVAILAVDAAEGAVLLAGTAHGRLRPDQQSYGPVIALTPPPEGRFQLFGTVLIAQAGLVKSTLGPVLHIVA